ncbi:hypothetical protein A8C56_06110 [Niabella ginsenosidivorans]|uniref:Uncharacterized protein n=1 Tax=Niabella ginsenosidivorans TaxID=1176587 RepID=A0A1A9HZB8_9BACT|nr:hypothetical protein A8C56_06110 [Niabella ginsenosidivorans]
MLTVRHKAIPGKSAMNICLHLIFLFHFAGSPVPITVKPLHSGFTSYRGAKQYLLLFYCVYNANKKFRLTADENVV